MNILVVWGEVRCGSGSHLMTYKPKYNQRQETLPLTIKLLSVVLPVVPYGFHRALITVRFPPKQPNTPIVWRRYLSISSREKQVRIKKHYKLEIEGAMVKRPLQTWINCIRSSVFILFPASVPVQSQIRLTVAFSLLLFSSLQPVSELTRGNVSAFRLALCSHVQKVRGRSKATPWGGVANPGSW